MTIFSVILVKMALVLRPFPSEHFTLWKWKQWNDKLAALVSSRMAGAVQSFHIHSNPDCGGSISLNGLNAHLFTGPWLGISRVKWKFWPQRTQSDISRVKCKGVKLPSFVIHRLLLSCRTRQAVCWLNLAFLRGNILKEKLSFWWERCCGLLLKPLCHLQPINKF